MPQNYLQPETPFMSGLKEGVMEGPTKGVAALALKIMDHQLEQQKLDDYRKLKELMLQKDIEKTRRENLLFKLDNALKMAAEARAQGFDPQIPMGQANAAFREITGSDLPYRERVMPASDVTSPALVDAAMEGVPGVQLPAPQTTREYLVPRSGAELKEEQLAQLYDLKTKLMQSTYDERLELAKIAAELKAKGQLDKGGYKRDPNKLRDDIRQHYGMKSKMYLDPLTGTVLPGKEQEYKDLLEDMERDLQWLDKGYKTRYETGGRSLTPLARFLRGATNTKDLETKVWEAYKQHWSPEEIAWALDELDLGQELKREMKSRGEPVIRRKVPVKPE